LPIRELDATKKDLIGLDALPAERQRVRAGSWTFLSKPKLLNRELPWTYAQDAKFLGIGNRFLLQL